MHVNMRHMSISTPCTYNKEGNRMKQQHDVDVNAHTRRVCIVGRQGQGESQAREPCVRSVRSSSTMCK